jgi:hypothetical protein
MREGWGNRRLVVMLTIALAQGGNDCTVGF